MKIFTNKNIWSKLVIAVLIVFAFQFVTSSSVNTVSATDGDSLDLGGKLLKPVFSLIVTAGDAVMDVLHHYIMGWDEGTLIEVKEDGFSTLFWVALCVVGLIGILSPIGWTAAGVAALAIGAGGFVYDAVTTSYGDYNVAVQYMTVDELPTELWLPQYSYSPEEIFKGRIALLDVNFFDPMTIQGKDEDGDGTIDYYYYEADEDGDGVVEEIKTSQSSSSSELQPIISSWYKAIRNVCIVAMLSILVYIGIRMLLSSVATDKAKYKTMLKDWFVGLCLLFLMHYIMAFSVTLVEKLTDLVSTTMDTYQHAALADENDRLKNTIKETLGQDKLDELYDDGTNTLIWPTNLMGMLRLRCQLGENGYEFVGESILFLILVIFTIMFTFTYLRRLLYMAFLTIIAPLVALTYCIDKTNDGQAQGFDKWLKEYIFNLLIQPMHLLLYFILVASAEALASTNVIYSLVAIGFMLPAEKLLRSLFGFEKAQTAPSLAGPAVTAGVVSATQKLLDLRGKGGSRARTDSSRSLNSANDTDSGKTPRTGMRTETLAKLGRGNEPSTEQSSDANGQEPRFANAQGEDEKTQPVVGMGGTNTALGNSGTTREQEVLGNPNANGTVLADGQQGYEKIPEGYNAEVIGTNEANVNEVNTNLDTPDTIRMATMSQPEIEQAKAENKENYNDNNNSTNVPQGRLAKIKNKAKRKIKSATSDVTTAALDKQIGKKVRKGVWKATKGTIVGAPIGIAAMSLGAAAAIATGEPKNLGLLGGAGLATGVAAGKSAANFKASDHISQEVKDAYNSVYNGPEYKEEIKQDKIDEAMKDSKLNNELRTEFGQEKLTEMKKDGTIEQYIKNGKTTAEDIITGEKLREKGYTKDIDESCAVIDVSDGLLGGKTLATMNDDAREKVINTLDGRFAGHFNGNAERAAIQTDRVMSAAHACQQIKAGNDIGKIGTDKSQIKANKIVRAKKRNTNNTLT